MSAPSRTSAASSAALTADCVEVGAGIEERAAIGRARQDGEDRDRAARARGDRPCRWPAITVLSPPTQIACAFLDDQRVDRVGRPRRGVHVGFEQREPHRLRHLAAFVDEHHASSIRPGSTPTPMRLSAGQHLARQLEGRVDRRKRALPDHVTADVRAGCRDPARRPTANGSATSVKM